MRFRLLGPLRVWDGAALSPIRAAQQRVVLSMLLIETGRLVSVDRLVDEIWGEQPPRGAVTVIRGYVMRLRRLLGGNGSSPVLTRPNGYELVTAADDVDALVFQRLVASGRSALNEGAGERAIAELSQALALWRGQALADVPTSPTIAEYVTGLEQARLAAVEDHVEGKLSLGRYGDVISEVEHLVNLHPLRERLWEHLVLALSRSGRRADALGAYQRARAVLAAELGLEPGRRLQELQRAILTGNDQPPAKTTLSGVTPPNALVVPRQLPADTTAFTGRLRELRELDAVLRTSGPPLNAAVVTGAAGIGKTALAIHWAHRVADRFPDGQLYADLRGYHPDQPTPATDAIAAFLTALGVAGPHIPLGENERAARYRTEVAGRRMLIVLDNAATVEQVRPLLPGTGTSTVLVTSRDSLAGLVARDGARRLNLDLLPPADAHALLNRLIGPQAETDPDAVATLADLCDRLPLALRVAAELAISRPHTSLADLTEELADQQQRLDLLDPGGDPQAAVTAVFSWSMRHLPRDAVRTFRLTGLHPGADLDVYAAAALVGSSVATVRRHLDALTRAHLLHHTATGRYGMHDLLRAYASTLSTAEDPEPDRRVALGRLFDYYVAAAAAAMDHAFPAEAHRRLRIPPPATTVPVMDPTTARVWLDTERATLIRVAAYTAGDGWPGHTVRLSTTLNRYFDGGYFTDALALHGYACQAAEAAGDQTGQAWALRGIGSAHLQMGRLDQAAEHFERALALCRHSGDLLGEGITLTELGRVDQRRGRYTPARQRFEEAITLLHEVGDLTGAAHALNNLGIIEHRQGSLASAAKHHEDAITLFRELGDQLGEAAALTNLGLAEQRRARYESAENHYQQALALFRQFGDREGEASTLDNLGAVYNHLGDFAKATDHFVQALAIFRDMGDREGEVWVLNGLGETAHATGQVAAATTHHTAALAIAATIGARDQEARAHAGLGNAHRDGADPGRARHHYELALALYIGLEAPEADDLRTRLASLT